MKRTLENFRANMETGLPELGLPPIDPMTIDEIGFKFFEVNAAFTNTKLRGFKDFKLESSKVDKQKRYNDFFPNVDFVACDITGPHVGLSLCFKFFLPSIELGMLAFFCLK